MHKYTDFEGYIREANTCRVESAISKDGFLALLLNK
jgi:hypothetical protein